MSTRRTTVRTLTLGLAPGVICALLAGGCSKSDSGGSGGSGGTSGGTSGGGTPSVTPSVSSLAVNPTSVVGGTGAQGTVNLNVAPTAGTNVALSSNNAAATVPASVTVNSAVTSANFNITTSAVQAATPVTITGTLNGSQTAVLTLMPVPPPAFQATFVVRSLTAAMRKVGSSTTPVANRGAGSIDTCPLINDNGNPRLSCEFDGAGSTSPRPISEYRWTWKVGNNNNQDSQNNSETKFQPKVSNCGLFTGQEQNGLQLINMVVTLVIRDNANPSNSSPVTTNQNVVVFPAGLCGYPF